MQVKRTQAERSATTTGAVVWAARELFGKRGYADVSVAEVVSRAALSKGAIYHHFRDKREVLSAVVDQIESELANDIRACIDPLDDPVDQLITGCAAFLDRCLDPAARRIAILDAPAVLGWKELRAIDARHGLGIMIEVLEQGMAAGAIRRQPTQLLAHLFLAAAIEAAMLIANAKNPASERERVARPLFQWLASLRVTPKRTGASVPHPASARRPSPQQRRAGTRRKRMP